MTNHSNKTANRLLEYKAQKCNRAARKLSSGTIIRLYFRSRHLRLKVKVSNQFACIHKHTHAQQPHLLFTCACAQTRHPALLLGKAVAKSYLSIENSSL